MTLRRAARPSDEYLNELEAQGTDGHIAAMTMATVPSLYKLVPGASSVTGSDGEATS